VALSAIFQFYLLINIVPEYSFFTGRLAVPPLNIYMQVAELPWCYVRRWTP